jgi:hypothetical protein
MSILLWHNPPPFGLRIQSCAGRALDKVYCQRNKCGNIRGRVVPIQVAMGQLHHKCHHSHLKNMINVLKNCKPGAVTKRVRDAKKAFPSLSNAGISFWVKIMTCSQINPVSLSTLSKWARVSASVVRLV